MLTGTLPPTKTDTRAWAFDPDTGLLTITSAGPKRTAADVYLVAERGPGDYDLVKQDEALPEGVEPTTYAVVIGRGCSCPDFRYRGRDCKHTLAVRGMETEMHCAALGRSLGVA